jgi:hypothetical protein
MHTDAANAIFPKPCRCPFNLCQNVGCRFFPISPISVVLLLMAMKKGRSHDYKKKTTTKHFVVQHQSKVLAASEVLPGALTKANKLPLSRSWNRTKLIPQTLKTTDTTNPKIMAPKTKV